MEFKELKLSQLLLDEIDNEGYKVPTPIQELAIPHILNNKDVLGIAQTGTGKTAAFSLPILEKLIQGSVANKKIKVLVLSPTRELALQIRDNIRNYSSNTKFKCSVVLGGVNQSSQIRVLNKGVDILVATPGRLVDLVKRNFADLSNVEMLVLDEADTMLDMGFIRDIRYLISKTPTDRQTMLFSATMPKEIKELSQEFLTNPEIVSVTPVASTVPKITQLLYYVDKKNKINLLLDLLSSRNLKNALVFTRTKFGANKLSEQLEEFGVKCSVIHGNKSQEKRVKALRDFKECKTNVLIATDIAARGIDISELSHVINYDMPEQAELYVHRIGRTARAGLEGTSISLCSSDELGRLKDVERLINQNLEVVENTKYPMLEKLKELPKKDKSNKANQKTNNNGKQNNASNKEVSHKRRTRNKDSYRRQNNNRNTSNRKRSRSK